MSHTSSIKSIKIVSITALDSAVKELAKGGMKISMIKNATPRAYFQNQQGMGKADYVIKLDSSPYDIGAYKQEDGTYELRTDFFAGHVEKLLGAKASKKENTEQAKLGKLYQLYGLHAATEQARKKGLTVRRQEGKDGEIKLVLANFA